MIDSGEALQSPGRGAGPGVVVDSVTGVEVSLPLAGPGARSFAFIVDWHIRAVIALAWYVLAAFTYHQSWTLAPPPDPDSTWFVFVVAPPAAIYFLYHYVLEVAMHGRTPGKRMAGVRLVARDGSVPSVGSLLTRNVFRLVDSFPVFYGVGLIATLFTRDHVRVGDLAAGTLLVYDRANTPLLEHVSGKVLGGMLDASTAEVVNELLRRWTTLDASARRRLAHKVLERHGVSPHEPSAVTSGEPPTSSGVSDEMLRLQLERLARGERS